jgi:Zn-dependent protease with chaperone function
MFRQVGKFAMLASAFAIAMVASTAAEARPMSMRLLAAQELRLATISYRIATANAHTCAKREVMSGMVLHDLSRYEPALRPAIAQAFSLNSGIGILGVVPGSVADEAGLRTDDEILQVGPYSVQDGAALTRRKSFARMEQFDRILQAAMTYGQTDLIIRRQGVQLRLPMRASYGCGGKLTLSASDSSNAWADGRNVLVTTGMTGLSKNDDEIAFVIAHEMAHNILGHVGNSDQKRGIFGIGSVKQAEIAADDYAVELMSNGGYQPTGGIAFLQNARRRMWWSFSLDHPGFGRRIAIVNAAIARVTAHTAQLATVTRPAPVIVAEWPAIRPTYDKGATKPPLLRSGS